jgi:hypothetical protein
VDWLKRLLAAGRLRRPPADQNAGRFLPPASAQRTQLGLAEVDLSRGVVRLRSGEVRAMLRVTGYPAHHRSTEDARAWLTGYARALNALPSSAALLVRSRPGGLERDVARQGTQAAALARREPGSGLAKLAADQLAHARRLMESGATRRTDPYVAVRNERGDVRALLDEARAVAGLLEGAGVRCELVKDRDLAAALADSWRPGLGEHFTQDFESARGDVLTLVYSPGYAKVTTPRYTALTDQQAPPALPRDAPKKAPSPKRRPRNGGRSAPGSGGKAETR